MVDINLQAVFLRLNSKKECVVALWLSLYLELPSLDNTECSGSHKPVENFDILPGDDHAVPLEIAQLLEANSIRSFEVNGPLHNRDDEQVVVQYKLIQSDRILEHTKIQSTNSFV